MTQETQKYLLSAVVIFAFIAYAIHYQLESSAKVTVTPQSTQKIETQTVNQNFKDGEYTGEVVDAFYGNVQVKAVISQGKISDVQFLDYPHDRKTSIEINTAAMPALKQEAIMAQNANVDVVSGATQTSEAFRKSLQTALDQANK